jgi:hypothetical protein
MICSVAQVSEKLILASYFSMIFEMVVEILIYVHLGEL